MDGTVFTALVSGAVALGVVTLSNYFGRKRDHEADWRKMKLEYYKEYVAAFSRGSYPSPDAAETRRYHDAVNCLALVAPPNVLTELYAFQKGIESEEVSRDPFKWMPLWSSLMRVMREDCHPKPPKDNLKFIFLIIHGRSDKTANNNEKTLCPEK